MPPTWRILGLACFAKVHDQLHASAPAEAAVLHTWYCYTLLHTGVYIGAILGLYRDYGKFWRGDCCGVCGKKKLAGQRGISSVFLALCRHSSEASCCSKTRVNYCHSHGLRMSAAHFQCSSAIISLNLGFRIWSVESRAQGLRSRFQSLGLRVWDGVVASPCILKS